MSSATPDPAIMADRRGLESLISFWADAGVEALYAETPLNRTLARRKERPLEPAILAPIPAPEAAAAAQSPDLTEPRRLAAAARSLDELRRAAAGFIGEALAGKPGVYWRGAADAAVVVIGAAPGLDDETSGQPFAGAAGRLLDRMLAAAGLEGRVLITNTLFWRPPGDRAPSALELGLCAPFLERAIALAAPKALLLAGAGPAKALLGRSEPVLALHGRWLEWRSADGALRIPALPTLSPAFLLRQPLAKRMSWADLLTLSERIERPARP